MDIQLQHALSTHNLNLTRPRREVFEALLAHAPCSTAILAGYCRRVDRVTVYRTVALFERLGIVTRVWRGLKSELELGELFVPHHHHLICDNCGKAVELKGALLEDALERTARQHGFVLLAHSVELTGRCRECLPE